MIQANLFSNQIGGAIFSEDRKYRYVLWRIWGDKKPVIAFIGLNPSTANEDRNDPTIRRCMSFAQKWGYSGLYMLNLFALVTPDPEELLQCECPVGDNNRYLIEYAEKCDRTVFAWGSFKEATDRALHVMGMMSNEAYALQINKNGTPKHPLYVKGNIVPVVFKPRNK